MEGLGRLNEIPLDGIGAGGQFLLHALGLRAFVEQRITEVAAEHNERIAREPLPGPLEIAGGQTVIPRGEFDFSKIHQRRHEAFDHLQGMEVGFAGFTVIFLVRENRALGHVGSRVIRVVFLDLRHDR